MELNGNPCLQAESQPLRRESIVTTQQEHSGVAGAFLTHVAATISKRQTEEAHEVAYRAVQEGSRRWWNELAEFWKSPASIRGFHRPNQTQGDHSRRVFNLASRYWARVPWAHIRHDRRVYRSFLRAALFHDVGKITDRVRHEIEGFRWMLPRDELSAFFILHHMGRWSCISEAEKRELLARSALLHLLTEENRWLCDLLCGADFTEACCWDIT